MPPLSPANPVLDVRGLNSPGSRDSASLISAAARIGPVVSN